MRNSEKILTIIADLRISKSEFANRVGIEKSTLSSWLNRDTIDFLKVAEAFPEINAEWLLRDQGEMREINYDVSQIYEPDGSVKELSPEYNAQQKTGEDMITIPASVLSALRQQLESKDAQIATLLEIMNKK